MQLEHDETYMRVALHMARRGLGTTSPNPAVGAVIVSDTPGGKQISARAVTGVGGTPHGEPQAISQAGEQAKGATLYVTLEPCNHQGRTPPCTEAIIKAGLKRVVVASTDLDERVKGTGLERLREAGIEVLTGICKQEADTLNKGHFLRQTEDRPYTIVKMAVSKNGLVAAASENSPTWVTSPLARKRGHLLRAEVDAILVGRKTAEQDNPTLTCRLNGLEHRSPRPVIIDRNLALSADLKIFNPNIVTRPWVITNSDQSKQKISKYQERDCELIHVNKRQAENSEQESLDVKEITNILAQKGITRLLVEGGPTTAQNFLKANLVDQVNIFKGANPLSGQNLLPFGSHSLSWLEDELGFELDHSQKLGDNQMDQFLKI
ncbi:MAG: riboflavin biosynthesis protein RibD [Methyloligella sp.]|nr:MAG: riboflavin biosynthesis protein RibD [Methyloligella sp.]